MNKTKLFFLILLISIFYILINKDYRKVHPYINQTTKTLNIAHRGGLGLSPENTIFSFNKAVASGADILEMDIHSTSDSILVLLHDNKLNRTTNGKGYVWDFTIESIKELNAGFYWTKDDSITFPFRESGIEIPTLEEVFINFKDYKLNIEIKHHEAHVAKNLCHLIQKYDMQSNVLVGSFNDKILLEFRKDCPSVATSSARDETKLFYGLNYLYLDYFYSPNLDIFQLPEYFRDTYVLSENFIKSSQNKNIPIFVWTINDSNEMKRFIDLGINGIITDYPDRLSEVLKTYNSN